MPKYTEDLNALKDSGKLVELFCLRPTQYKDKTVTLRLKINKCWNGWRIKHNMLKKLNLKYGDTICTLVTPQFTKGLSNEVKDMMLFVSGDGINWITEHDVTAGSTIDCEVKFSYVNIDQNPDDPKYMVNLIFVEGYKVITDIPKKDISFDDIIADL